MCGIKMQGGLMHWGGGGGVFAEHYGMWQPQSNTILLCISRASLTLTYCSCADVDTFIRSAHSTIP